MQQQPTAGVSIYVAAHADDFQLFMQPGFYADLLNPHRSVVCLLTTAGDAGKDTAYWKAREEGLKSSIRFCLAPRHTLVQTTGHRTCQRHLVPFWTLNGCTVYFLRLPDGNLDGTGFASQNNQSLQRLRIGQISTITAVDGSATYAGWMDVCETLHQLIRQESAGNKNTLLHYLSPDTDANPDDHADHRATGLALQAITGCQQVRYAGYAMPTLAEPLAPEDLFWKAGMLAAYEKAVYDACGYSTLRESVETYVGWCLCTACMV